MVFRVDCLRFAPSKRQGLRLSPEVANAPKALTIDDC
jgi:hypothetical protein